MVKSEKAVQILNNRCKMQYYLQSNLSVNVYSIAPSPDLAGQAMIAHILNLSNYSF